MLKVYKLFISLLFYNSCFAQLGTWNIANVKVNFKKNWSMFGEAQLRSLAFYNNFHYYELKTGLTYNINKNFSVQSGVGNYDTYAEGGSFKTPMVNDELRTWIQFAMKQSLERIKFEHRYRAEQRWTVNGYRNRFRYRFQAVIPVNNKKIEKGVFYTTAWDEIFFTNNAPYFERNRVFIGGGYELTNELAIQCGFLNQFDFRLNDETGRNFLQLALLYEIAISKKKQEHLPGGVE
jgi:Protein of unknown function (DUF2490)